ncbi:MAG TPA: sulfite exporter TauE/SafE family protein [Candidatus Thermoplasmatota archaeon]|nr:sulfite exporter TauE/SafE family protein [Candidatus Thermoplasmatota archaeon]
MDWPGILGLLAAGAVAGVLSSLFGIGGGIVLVPVLHYLLGFEWVEATQLSLVAIMVQSPTGVWQHARRGAVDWAVAFPLAMAGLLGVVIGDVLQPLVAVSWLKVLFATLMALAAMRLAVPQPPPAPDARPLGRVGLYLLGLFAGIVAKLLGIGGGLVTVPVLALTGLPVHLAVGSSLVPVFTNAAVASGQALAHGLDWRPAVPLALGALAGVPLGAHWAHALKEQGLRRVFAAGLALAALYIGLTSGVV